MATVEPMLADPQYIEDLTADELIVWNSYQRFLHCFVFPGPLSYDGMVIAAALLALATVTKPVTP